MQGIRNFFLFVLFINGLTVYAQSPQWSWAKSVGGPGPDGASKIVADSTGNLYEYGGVGSAKIAFGSYTSPNNADGAGYIAKYSPGGNVLWANFYKFSSNLNYSVPGAPAFLSMTLDHAGNLCVVGIFATNIFVMGRDTLYAQANTSGGTFMAKFNPKNGALLSLRNIGLGSNSFGSLYFSKIVSRAGGHFVALGNYNGPETHPGDTIGRLFFPYRRCSFLADLDSGGNITGGQVLSVDTIPYQIYFDDLTLSSTGNIYLSGSYDSLRATTVTASWNMPTLISDSSDYVFLAKFDSNFNFLWSIKNTYHYATYFGSVREGNVFQTSLAPGLNDNVYMAGSFFADTFLFNNLSVACYRPPVHYGRTVFLAKFDSSGTAQWLKASQSPAGDVIANNLASDPLGNVYMYLGSGYSELIVVTDTLMNCYDQVIVAKINPDGGEIWATNSTGYGGAGSGNMAIDGIGDVYVGGAFGAADEYFGADTVLFHTPVSGHPEYQDAFTAKLGNCSAARPVVKASGPLALCGADSVTLTAPTSYAYIWTNGSTKQAVTLNHSGSYAVCVIDSMGCYAKSKPDVLNSYPQPALKSYATAAVCRGDSTGQLHLITLNATGPVHYSFVPTVADTMKLPAGSYIITATDSAGCIATDTTVVHQPDNKLMLQLHVSNVLCKGDSTGHINLITLNATGAVHYSFDPSSTDSIKLPAGSYVVTATDSIGCIATDTAVVHQPDNKLMLQLHVSNVLCKGDSTGHINLKTLNAAGAVHYSFDPTATDSIKLPAGSYVVTATDSIGCIATDTAVVHQPANKLTLQVNYYSPANGHKGEAIATATGGTPGYHFDWLPGSASTDTLKNPAPGLYTATVMDSNGCSATDSLTVPTATGIQQAQLQTHVSIYPNPSTGSFYIETPEAGEFRIYNMLGNMVQWQTAPAGKTQIASALAKGTYLLEVISANGTWRGKIVLN